MRKYLTYILAAVVLAGIIVPWLFEKYDYPPSHEVKNIEYIEQPDDITCGPTSALMVLRRYGKSATLDQVKAEAKTQWFTFHGKPVGMTSPDYVARAMTKLGVPCVMRQGSGTTAKVKHFVSQNRPVIVLVRSSPTTWHFVVVVGYDDNKIVVADPSRGARREMPLQDFESCWAFTTDMDGVPVTSPCGVCAGSGKIFAIDLGPVFVCDVCGGSGRQPDYVGGLIRTADVYPNTMIIPSIHIED